MARTQGGAHVFSVEGVAKNFRSDWQFLVAASRVNSALSLATLFSVVAVVTKFADLVNLGTPALFSLILASLSYVAAISIIKIRAPKVIQEYPDYKTYEDKKHSHRWILWQFYHEIQKLKHGYKLLQETIDKKLSSDVATLRRSRLPTNASFGRPSTAVQITGTLSNGASAVYDICLYAPHNFDRDLIMGFTIRSSLDGVERSYVLPIRETDPKLDLKVKELFWITLTEAAKENPTSRWIAWTLVRASGLLLGLAAVFAVSHVLLTPKPTEPVPCCVHKL